MGLWPGPACGFFMQWVGFLDLAALLALHTNPSTLSLVLMSILVISIRMLVLCVLLVTAVSALGQSMEPAAGPARLQADGGVLQAACQAELKAFCPMTSNRMQGGEAAVCLIDHHDRLGIPCLAQLHSKTDMMPTCLFLLLLLLARRPIGRWLGWEVSEPRPVPWTAARGAQRRPSHCRRCWW